MNPEELITRAKIQIQKKNSFFAYLSLFLKFKETKELPEHAGMGVSITGDCYYKKEFVEEITSGNNTEQLEGVITHELLHLALLHLLREGERDKDGFNCATDLVINTLLRSNGFSLPEGCLMPDYDNKIKVSGGKIIKDIDKKTAEEVYDEFPKVKREGNYYVLASGKDKGKKLGKVFDKHIYGKGLSPKEKKKAEKNWLNKVSEAINLSRMKGDIPVGLERLAGKLFEEEIDWKSLLQKFIINSLPYNYTYAKPHKKSVSVGEYLPDILKEKIDISVVIDLSGSIGQKEYSSFISEIIGLARAYQERITMKFYSHDTECYDGGLVENGNIEKIKNLNLKGGGGTSHQSTFKHIRDNERNCKAVLFFTDGFSDIEQINFEEYPFEKLFVITKDGDDECLKGKNCQIIKLKGRD